MNDPAQQDPILLLEAIERRSRDNAQGLPQQVEVRSTWDGLAFRLGDNRLVAPLSQVREILSCPPLTRVPGAKAWIKGIANVRGTLIPVVDLQGFMTGQALTLGRGSRVLVVQHKGIGVGLLVDEVLGQKHFLEDEKATEPPDMGKEITPYLCDTYRQSGELWVVFGMDKLIESGEFMQVAA